MTKIHIIKKNMNKLSFYIHLYIRGIIYFHNAPISHYLFERLVCGIQYILMKLNDTLYYSVIK